MKKAMKIAAVTVGGLIGTGLIIGTIYDLLGLIYKSQKDHGWVVMSKEARKHMPISDKLKLRVEAADDIMEDVNEGWAWRFGI